MTPQQAEHAIVRGVTVCVLIAITTAILVVAARSSLPHGAPEAHASVLRLVDVVILLAVAYGLHVRSRTVALILVALVLASAGLKLSRDSGVPTGGLPVQLVFIYFLGRAAQATFVLHRRADPS